MVPLFYCYFLMSSEFQSALTGLPAPPYLLSFFTIASWPLLTLILFHWVVTWATLMTQHTFYFVNRKYLHKGRNPNNLVGNIVKCKAFLDPFLQRNPGRTMYMSIGSWLLFRRPIGRLLGFLPSLFSFSSGFILIIRSAMTQNLAHSFRLLHMY